MRGLLQRRSARVPQVWRREACMSAAWLAVVAVVTGCGRPATTAKGVVTLDGLPVQEAIVEFTPEHRNARTAVAVTDREGRYEVPVAAVPLRVSIKAQRVVGQVKNDSFPDGPLVDVKEDVVPARYRDTATSPLTVEPVEGRRTVADFPLSSKP